MHNIWRLGNFNLEPDRCDLRGETARVEEETVEPSDGVVDCLRLGQTEFSPLPPSGCSAEWIISRFTIAPR